jgi:hypothetical protein
LIWRTRRKLFRALRANLLFGKNPELATLFIEAGGKSVVGDLAVAAKEVVLLKQQHTRFYPPNWIDVFVLNITADIDLQILRVKFGKLFA